MTKQQDAVHSTVHKDLYDRIVGLEKENDNLRQCLLETQKALAELTRIVQEIESRSPQTVVHNHYHYPSNPNVYQPPYPNYPWVGDPPTVGPTCGGTTARQMNLCDHPRGCVNSDGRVVTESRDEYCARKG